MTSSDAVTLTLDGPVAVLRLDDGKANAISNEVAAALSTSLDDAIARGARAIAIVGRPGRFSAGFDLATMRSGPEAARDLLRAGAELGLQIYRAPVPVVLGVTGHALAMGAILLMAADTRIGARGEYKIGLNEVAIGMPVPRFAVELAQDRLSRRHVTAAVNLARVFDPEGAVDAGYLDELAELGDVETAAIARAAEYAEGLVPAAFALTRQNLRGERADRIAAGLAADVAAFAITEA